MFPTVGQNDSFSQKYKSYGGVDSASVGNVQSNAGPSDLLRGARHSHSALPNMNEVDFTGRYKDKIMGRFPKANYPHLKRIIN